jgi:hypothetical protein
MELVIIFTLAITVLGIIIILLATILRNEKIKKLSTERLFNFSLALAKKEIMKEDLKFLNLEDLRYYFETFLYQYFRNLFQKISARELGKELIFIEELNKEQRDYFMEILLNIAENEFDNEKLAKIFLESHVNFYKNNYPEGIVFRDKEKVKIILINNFFKILLKKDGSHLNDFLFACEDLSSEIKDKKNAIIAKAAFLNLKRDII